MTHINAYLNFNGNCRAAMTFYQQCLGGELVMQTIADSPIASHMPPEIAGNILHSTLTTPAFTLMASDMGGPQLKPGNSISLMLACSSEAELHACFEKLAANGHVVMAPAVQFWGALYGQLTDLFGNDWLLQYEHSA
jgi:PhnB protein